MPAPFDTIGTVAATPLVVSVPHAGRDYPPSIEDRLAVALARTVALEDRYVEVLAEKLSAAGHLVLVARTPRLLIDLNRAETDLDAAMAHGDAPVSARARGGLGVVPTRLPGVGALWRTMPDHGEVEARLRETYRPYHAAIADALRAARARWGFAVLVDLHSMPPLPGAGGAQIVLGDRHGSTAAPLVVAAAQAACIAAGFRVIRNAPYAGGEIVTRHGRSLSNIHAIQIEVDRRCYLDKAQLQPTLARHRVSAALADAADRMIDALDDFAALAAD